MVATLHFLFKLHLLVLLLCVLEVIVVRHVQPWVVQHLLSSGSPIMVPRKHWQEEVSEGLGFFITNEVLISEDFLHWPEAETLDPAQISSAIEKLA